MRKIGIFSAKGGVGKTTLTANLGAALTTEFYRDTVLLDGNISEANLALHFGISYPHLTLDDVLRNRIKINRAIYIDDYGIKIIPASLGKTKTDPRKIRFFLKDLDGMCEILLIDTPPATKGEVEAMMDVIDDVIVVTTPDVPSITGCIKTIDLADGYNKKILGIVLNKVKKRRYEITEEEVESTSNVKVISIIPEDENITKSVALQKPVVITSPYSPSATQFMRLAAYIIGEDYSRFGFFWRIKSWLGFGRSKRETEKARLTELKIRMGNFGETVETGTNKEKKQYVQQKLKKSDKIIKEKIAEIIKAAEQKEIEEKSEEGKKAAEQEHAEANPESIETAEKPEQKDTSELETQQ